MSRPRYTVAEARDIAQHVVTMRRCVLTIVHAEFHGALAFPDPATVYAHHGVLLLKHFGMAWLPLGLGAVALRGFDRTHVLEVAERIIDRVGPCPGLHDVAVAGLDDIERAANGEVI